METELCLILYGAILIGLLALLIHTVKTGRKWMRLLGLELAAAVVALAVMLIADQLPGSGMMPGLTHFGAVVISMGAAAIYGGLLILSLLVMAIRKNKKDENNTAGAPSLTGDSSRVIFLGHRMESEVLQYGLVYVGHCAHQG